MADVAIHVTITLNAPLLVTARQVGFVWESQQYIPGSVLRGSLAHNLLFECNLSEAERLALETAPSSHRDNCAFHRLFYANDPPRFGNAFPGLEPPVGILPLTARTCKRYSGFKRKDVDNERHGVFDILIRQVLSEKSGKPLTARCSIANCKKKAEPFGERVYALRGNRYVSPRALPRRLARTAIGRERGAVAERLLYTLEALGEQMDLDELDQNNQPKKAHTTFQTTVWAEEAHERELRRALRKVHYLGAAVSRGMGRVAISARKQAKPTPTSERLAVMANLLSKGVEPKRPTGLLPKGADWLERLLIFNQLWAQERKSFVDKQKSSADGWYFSVDLQADTLLSRVNGPAYQLTPDLLGLPDKVQLVRAFASHRQVGGWSSAWGMPKPTAPAIVAGSVFLYHIPGGDVTLSRDVLKQLHTLERQGVGQRREEGYGWLQICTPFHLETEVRS